MQTFWKNVEDMSLPFLLKYFENGPYNELFKIKYVLNFWALTYIGTYILQIT